ncbi:MAG TPA: hypothetical protein EYP31_00130, partial [Roseibacterium sp.]|nr:hypothetical protein [Roseibacterium sp.]
MGALRLICFVSGLSAAVAFVPGLVRAQAESGIGVAVTSGVIDADTALDVPDGELPRPAPLLHVLPDNPEAEVVPEISALAPAASPRPSPRDSWAVPTAMWDDHPDGSRWTAAVLAALRGPGAPLLEVEPRDIHVWCPGYLEASPAQRAGFWTGLISTLAWHESTHRPGAVGGGGQWFGLVQIAPGTARWRECDVRSAEALMSGPANLRCGIRIMAITVPRDNVVAEGMGGVAADWGPFHSPRKRGEMRNWVRDQEYCATPPPQMRPAMRPDGLRPDGLRPDGLRPDGLRPDGLR